MTDKFPKPSQNIVLESVQLFFWMFFRPKRWVALFKTAWIGKELEGKHMPSLFSAMFFLLKTFFVGLTVVLLPSLSAFGFFVFRSEGYYLTLFIFCLIICFTFSLSFSFCFLMSQEAEKLFSNLRDTIDENPQLEQSGDEIIVSIGLVFFGIIVGVIGGILLASSALLILRLSRFKASASLSILIGLFSGASGSAFGMLAAVLGFRSQDILSSFLLGLFTPWNFLIYKIDSSSRRHNSNLLYLNLAFWNEWQTTPVAGLDSHLLLIIERNNDLGAEASQYLSKTNQLWAIEAIQIEHNSRQLESCNSVFQMYEQTNGIDVEGLGRYASEIFFQFRRISEDVELVRKQENSTKKRIILREIIDSLSDLESTLGHASKRSSLRLKCVASKWQSLLISYWYSLGSSIEDRQELVNPYYVGKPLQLNQRIFTGRTDIVDRLELLVSQKIDQVRIPLLLYGQRRMGKTSLLNNLRHLLPNNIIPLFVDLQGPASRAKDELGFLYNLARGMVFSAQCQSGIALPVLDRESLSLDLTVRLNLSRVE